MWPGLNALVLDASAVNEAVAPRSAFLPRLRQWPVLLLVDGSDAQCPSVEKRLADLAALPLLSAGHHPVTAVLGLDTAPLLPLHVRPSSSDSVGVLRAQWQWQHQRTVLAPTLACPAAWQALLVTHAVSRAVCSDTDVDALYERLKLGAASGSDALAAQRVGQEAATRAGWYRRLLYTPGAAAPMVLKPDAAPLPPTALGKLLQYAMGAARLVPPKGKGVATLGQLPPLVVVASAAPDALLHLLAFLDTLDATLAPPQLHLLDLATKKVPWRRQQTQQHVPYRLLSVSAIHAALTRPTLPPLATRLLAAQLAGPHAALAGALAATLADAGARPVVKRDDGPNYTLNTSDNAACLWYRNALSQVIMPHVAPAELWKRGASSEAVAARTDALQRANLAHHQPATHAHQLTWLPALRRALFAAYHTHAMSAGMPAAHAAYACRDMYTQHTDSGYTLRQRPASGSSGGGGWLEEAPDGTLVEWHV